MSAQGFLDSLLKTAQSALQDTGLAQTTAQGGLGVTDLGKGALIGGALGLLLGGRRLRGLTGKLVKYGGTAAIGALAYKAYGDWQQQQGRSDLTPATLDRLPAPEAERHSRALLQALVAAAKADGHIDARERQAIEDAFGRLPADAALRRWLSAELDKPLDPAEVARAADTPALAAEIYLASLLAVDEQNFMERAYLDELARQLELEPGLQAQLENRLRAETPDGD